MNMNLEATSLNRRAFLARAGTGAAALSLGGLSPLFAQEKKTYPQGKAEHCIFVWLGGGFGPLAHDEVVMEQASARGNLRGIDEGADAEA